MPWLLVHFSATTVWLPQADAHEVAVDVAGVGAAPPGDDAWEPGALVPTGPWVGMRARGEPWDVPVATFRTDRDVALVKLGTDAASLSRLGVIDHRFDAMRDVPRMTTQTMRGDDGRRIGLHLDNWDRLPTAQRHASRNRASLNLGPEPRWFLFVDVDVVGGHPGERIPDTVSARALVHGRTPQPAVVRLRVPPGWAYIAPTENLLHDSWSLAQHEGSTHLPALGRFTPPLPTPHPGLVAITAALRVDSPAGIRSAGVPFCA